MDGYHIHKNGGGWVHDTSTVDDAVFIDRGVTVGKYCKIEGKSLWIKTTSPVLIESSTIIGENISVEHTRMKASRVVGNDINIRGCRVSSSVFTGSDINIRYSTLEVSNIMGRTSIKDCFIYKSKMWYVNFRDSEFSNTTIYSRRIKPIVGKNIKLMDANLFGDGDYHKTPPNIRRSDGYVFLINNEKRITAGCRNFSWEEAVAHWGNPEHHAHEESMVILETLERLASLRENFYSQPAPDVAESDNSEERNTDENSTRNDC